MWQHDQHFGRLLWLEHTPALLAIQVFVQGILYFSILVCIADSAWRVIRFLGPWTALVTTAIHLGLVCLSMVIYHCIAADIQSLRHY